MHLVGPQPLQRVWSSWRDRIRDYKTDAEGRYLLERLPPGDYRLGIKRRLRFTLGEGGDSWVEVSPSELEDVSVVEGEVRELDLKAAATSRLVGRLSVSGEPRPGVSLALQSVFGQSTSTDSDGAFEFAELRPGRHRLEIKLPGAPLPAYQPLEIEGELCELDVSLELGSLRAILSVPAEEQEILPRVDVVLWPQVGSSTRSRVLHGSLEMGYHVPVGGKVLHPMADGSLQVPELPVGDYLLKAYHPRFVLHPPVEFSVHPGEPTQLAELRLQPAASLTIRVNEAQTGRALYGRSLRLSRSGEQALRFSLTDREKIEIGGLREGVYELRVVRFGNEEFQSRLWLQAGEHRLLPVLVRK
jgi:hypothetical protein